MKDRMSGFFTPTSKNGGIPNLKLTPTATPNNNSPVFLSSRSNSSRSQSKSRQNSSSASTASPFSDCGLALRRVIGCSTTAFDSHPPSRSFAYTAGAAAVVVHLDDELQITQRFFRARPNAPTLVTVGASFAPSTPASYIQETRSRTAASLREAGIGYQYTNSASPFAQDDSPSSRTWSARERIKAATCLSFSPDGKWLAVGEVCYRRRRRCCQRVILYAKFRTPGRLDTILGFWFFQCPRMYPVISLPLPCPNTPLECAT